MCGNGAATGMVIIVAVHRQIPQVLLRALTVSSAEAAGATTLLTVAVLIAATVPHHPTGATTLGSVSPYRMVDSYTISIYEL